MSGTHATDTAQLAYVRRLTVGPYEGFKNLFGPRESVRIGRCSVSHIGDEFKKHVTPEACSNNVGPVLVDLWRTKRHVPIDVFKALVGIKPLDIMNVFSAFVDVELHPENQELTRLDFLAFVTSSEGEILGADFERLEVARRRKAGFRRTYRRDVSLDLFGAQQDFRITMGAYVAVPA